MSILKPSINTFDIDGVIYFGEDFTGVRPGTEDVIITGRSFTQKAETESMLHSRGIYNSVMYNPITRDDIRYCREESGRHKARCILELKKYFDVGLHFEDDPVQIEEIKKVHPELNIIYLVREGLIEY
jgi:hypothetical protein